MDAATAVALDMTSSATLPITDTFPLGGDLHVHRLGYGAMQITGDGVWGEPGRPRRRASPCCGPPSSRASTSSTPPTPTDPPVSEQLIAEALHPYPEGLVIATKAGLTRQGPGIWTPVGRPGLPQAAGRALAARTCRSTASTSSSCTASTPTSPLADQLGAFAELKDEGKVRHIGVSEVSVEQLKAARRSSTIASVQNLYNLTNRQSPGRAGLRDRRGHRVHPVVPDRHR